MDPFTTAGLAVGAGQAILGAIKSKQAMAAVPGTEDPMSRLYLNEIRRRRRAAETGTDMSSDRAAMRQMAKTGITAAMKQGGRVSSGFLSQISTQAAQNLAAARRESILQLLGMEGQQVGEMTQRKFDVNMYRSQVKSAEAAQMKKSANQNIMAALFPGGGAGNGVTGGLSGGVDKSTGETGN